MPRQRQKRIMTRLKGKYTKVVKSAPRVQRILKRRNTLNPWTAYKRKLSRNPARMFLKIRNQRYEDRLPTAPFVSGFTTQIKRPKGFFGKEKYRNSIFADVGGRRTVVNGPLAVSRLQAAVRGRQQRHWYNGKGYVGGQKQRLTKSRNRRFRPSY
jgi:hypothetical protein